MSPGLVLLVAVLAAAAGFGLWRRRTDGRLLVVAGAGSGSGAVADSLAAGSGAAGSGPARPDGAGSDAAVRLTSADLGGPLGERATLVQFSSAFCAPCRATRVVLDDVARLVPGVRHVDVDAEAHLALVRRLGVTRTPTVLVLDADGLVVRRATGAPRRADVLAALGEAV